MGSLKFCKMFNVGFCLILLSMLLLFAPSSSYAFLDSYVAFGYSGRAYYLEPGVLSIDKYRLEYRGQRQQWVYWDENKPSEIKYLSTPYECDYSKLRNLRLEPNGKLFLVRKNDIANRTEVRLVQGEWT